MVDVSTLNKLTVLLSLNQNAFGSRKRPTRMNLLIQLKKSSYVTKIGKLTAPMLVSLMITKICHLALHRKTNVTSIQVRKTENKDLVCTMPQKCLYRTFLLSCAGSAKNCKPTHFHVKLSCFPHDKFAS